jgi:putative Ca2+/H+ antiporter (TMEM165/GDT1 family)
VDLRTFSVVFGTVFLAELGDKTQLANVLFASGRSGSLLTVLLAASLALMTSTVLAVTLGAVLGELANPRGLAYVAGGGFVIIGIWMIVTA